MLSEMKPFHLMLLVGGLLCIYAMLVYPLIVEDNNLSVSSRAGTITSAASPLHLRSKYSDDMVRKTTRNQTAGDSDRNKGGNVTKLIRKSSKRIQYEYKDFSNLVGWSSDFHISTVKDIKDMLSKFKVKMIDKSLSGHCHLTNTCEEDLRVINRDNGLTLSSCPNRLRRQFYHEYKDDEELLSVDFFLCTHACSMCELFMPFGKPILVVSSTRYEIGRQQKVRWEEWNSNLALIMSKTAPVVTTSGHHNIDRIGDSSAVVSNANIVSANNRYDQEYMQYFTGLSGIELIPSLCETFREDDHSTPVTYQPTRPELLIAPSRDVNSYLADQLIATAAGKVSSSTSGIFASLMAMSGLSSPGAGERTRGSEEEPRRPPTFTVKHIRDLYPHFKYTDLAAHPAFIVIPYQISFMLFFELYYMNMPMFVPSPALLTQWHLKYHVLKERTWDAVEGHPEASSLLPRHPSSQASSRQDPNNEFDATAIREWIALADFYQFPHVIQFDSLEECIQKVAETDLTAVSLRMQQHNAERLQKVSGLWDRVLGDIDRNQNQRMRRSKGTCVITDQCYNWYPC